MKTLDLNGSWKLKGISPEGQELEINASVPGSTLSAVLDSEIENNLDVFYRDNADKVEKYENYSWIYTRSFEIDDTDKKWMLKFDKLDTYCDIYINGRHIAFCDNGYISYKFDITKYVVKGSNTIEVYFYSPILMTMGRKNRLCAFADHRRLYTRRPQCTYGWDWAMRFVTCGMGNASIVEIRDGMKIKSAYIFTKSIDEESAEMIIDIDFEDYLSGGVVDVKITDPNSNTVKEYSRYNEEEFMRINLEIENPMLWYPNGYGEQNIYNMQIESNGRVLYSAPFGIRTVKITELTDKEGSESYNKCLELKKTPFSQNYDKNTEFSCFILKINGVKILCKGANWVPCEPFSNGNTDKKVTSLLETARDAGVNMIRVWGGGDIETEHFYDECSRLGIMVTQDFLMACAQYPEDEEWFLEQLKKEAEYATELIRNKACLVWWSGDNENAVDGSDTDTNYRGRASAYKAIAPVIYKNDYNRRFLASSPYGGNVYASNTRGTTHNTQFLGFFFPYMLKEDVSDYKDCLKQYSARFIAEEPILGAVSERCLKNFMTKEDIYGDDLSMWYYHTKSNPALTTEIFEYMYSFAQGILGKFTNGEDRFFKFKYVQYEWLRVSLERVRREKWFCSGVIYWMLNDCWPAASGWALIDYYGEPKAAYYSFKRAAKQIVLSVDLENGMYKFHVCNDGKAQKLTLKWRTVSKDGLAVTESETMEIFAKENTSFVALEVSESSIPEECFVVADIECDRAFYKKGALDIIPADDRIESIEISGDTVKVKANSYIHALELCGDAVFEDNYFSLIAGEEKLVKFNKTGDEKIYAKAYTI